MEYQQIAAALAGLAFVAISSRGLRRLRRTATTLALVYSPPEIAGLAGSPGRLSAWRCGGSHGNLSIVTVGAMSPSSPCSSLTAARYCTCADLVSQLRFAVTVQDLRVVLLRRQRGERRDRHHGSASLVRREAPAPPSCGAGWAHPRYPAARLARMAALAISAPRRRRRPPGAPRRRWRRRPLPSRPRRHRAVVAGDRPPRRRRCVGVGAPPPAPIAPSRVAGMNVAWPSRRPPSAFALALPVTVAGACGSSRQHHAARRSTFLGIDHRGGSTSSSLRAPRACAGRAVVGRDLRSVCASSGTGRTAVSEISAIRLVPPRRSRDGGGGPSEAGG